MENIIVIAGPTATGKTAVSVELADRVDGEIISADSVQIYKYMDTGTAKPDENERKGIRHHLMDELYPDQEFNAAIFRKRAKLIISDITKRGKIPVVAGGTGLYIESLVKNIRLPSAKPDNDYREQMKRIADIKGNEYLHGLLEKIDPVAAKRIHVNDLKRIIRALEVFESTRKTITSHEKDSIEKDSEYRYLQFGLRMEREKLYERIDKRVDIMIEQGLLEETRELVDMGYGGCKPMQSLGYKEMMWYMEGKATFHEAIELIKRNTRRYAKRQMTWFRKVDELKWINVDVFKSVEDISENIIKDIACNGIFL